MKILTAMSGGVDSAMTAWTLLQQGHTVGGATMCLHSCAGQEVHDAQRSAQRLGIEFHVFELQKEFSKLVQTPFIEAYQRGLTPNPCIICNRTVKFGLFLDRALALGYEKIATGHYARIEYDPACGRYLIRTACDTSKDQTYMLYTLTQQQLARVVLPMGNMTKEQAREQAEKIGLEVAGKHDSQDICFIPDGDYLAWLKAQGTALQNGRFFGPNGEDYGEHKGLEAYTIGQRRGLALACGQRVYVTGKRGTDVLIGPNEALFANHVSITDVNWIAFEKADAPFRAQAKLRYTPRAAACTVVPTADGAELIFDEPQRAVTPGQAAVIYEGDLLLGGGTIAGAAQEHATAQ